MQNCNYVFGLQYNTKYYYKIGTGDSAREFWFQTPPAIDTDASYTFGIIGLSSVLLTFCLIAVLHYFGPLQHFL